VVPVEIEIPRSLWAEYAAPVLITVPESAELPTGAYVETESVS